MDRDEIDFDKVNDPEARPVTDIKRGMCFWGDVDDNGLEIPCRTDGAFDILWDGNDEPVCLAHLIEAELERRAVFGDIDRKIGQ